MRRTVWIDRRSLMFLLVLLGAALPAAHAAWSRVPAGAVRNTRTMPEQGTLAVQVTTDKLHYLTHEGISVSIANDLPDHVYLQAGQTYCSMVTLQRWEHDQWQPVGACPTDASRVIYSIGAGGALTLLLRPGPMHPAAQVPIGSSPVAPVVLPDDLSALPTTQPSAADEAPPRAQPLVFDATPLDAAPDPGVYRIEVSFRIGERTGPSGTVSSPEFVLTD